jgi:hypothetical protein
LQYEQPAIELVPTHPDRLMLRHLLNLATALSLLLAFASAGMWVRSYFVTEGWESKPRPSGMIYQGAGHHRQRHLESALGRLVYVNHKILIRASDPPIAGGYQRYAKPITPLRQSRRFADYPDRYVPYHTSGRIPGVAEWCSVYGHVFYPQGEYLAVSWLAIAAAFTVLPGTRVLLWVWRRRQSARPAFPVITPAT